MLTDKVSMLDGMRDLTYTPELVEKKFGVLPEKFVDYQALCGDKIDNIPGVPGIGKKTAVKLLSEFGDLDTILASTEQIGGSNAKKLEEHKDEALLSRRMARLDTEVNHGLELSELEFKAPDQEALNALFTDMEFFSLLKSTGESQVSENTKTSTTILAQDRPIPQELKTASVVVSVTGEVNGHLFEPVGLGLTRSDTLETLYIHEPCGQKMTEVQDFWKEFDGEVIVHDARDFFRWCSQYEFEIPQRVFDTKTASYLLDPGKGMPHDLPKLAKIHLHRVLKSETDLLGKGRSKKSWADVDTEELAEYSAHLNRACFELYTDFENCLKEDDLLDLAADEVELSLVLAKMELQGIEVHKESLESLSVEFRETLESLKQEIYTLAGREFNIGSPKQLAVVLFEDLGLPVIKKTKTGYSTKAEVLEKLAKDHEIAVKLLVYRKFEKLINTYVDVLLREIQPDSGRIHCQFGQTASTTGRLITSEPDLQRTPVRTDEGRRIRRCFKAKAGHKLLVADWSQVELRIMAHLSGDSVLHEAFKNGDDIHKRTASGLFDKDESEVTKEERDIAKTVNFATIYGQGSSALGQNLGIPKKRAKEIIERYFEVYSGVREWIDRTMEEARVMGRVSTIAGRTRFIPELFSKNFAVKQAGERMAVNTPVQGSAADICKKVMLDLDKALSKRPELKSKLLLQIHDELVFECPEGEVDVMMPLVTNHMENAWPLDVPLVVSADVGDNWEEAK